MHGRDVDVREIEGNLGDAVLLDEPADAFDALEFSGDPDVLALCVLDDGTSEGIAFACLATFFAYIEGDGVGAAGRGGVEVDVVADEKVSRTDRGRAGPGIELGRPEVGVPLRFLQFLGQALVFPRPDSGQVATAGWVAACS